MGHFEEQYGLFYLLFKDRLFTACHSRGTKPPCWDAKVALGQDQQKAYIILNDNFLRLSCRGATFASQCGGFVPREWQAAKSLLRESAIEQFKTNQMRAKS